MVMYHYFVVINNKMNQKYLYVHGKLLRILTVLR
jgi:hypothetical protein